MHGLGKKGHSLKYGKKSKCKGPGSQGLGFGEGWYLGT